jgi:hypothetical protein
VLGSPLAAVEAALDAGIGVRFAEHPTTFDGRQLSRIKLMSRPASGPAQRQGGTPSEPIVSLDTTKSASRKVNELSEQPTARRRRTPTRSAGPTRQSLPSASADLPVLRSTVVMVAVVAGAADGGLLLPVKSARCPLTVALVRAGIASHNRRGMPGSVQRSLRGRVLLGGHAALSCCTRLPTNPHVSAV